MLLLQQQQHQQQQRRRQGSKLQSLNRRREALVMRVCVCVRDAAAAA